VPSHSNIADKPSGVCIAELVEKGFKNHSENAAIQTRQLFAFMELKLGRKAECVVRSRCKK